MLLISIYEGWIFITKTIYTKGPFPRFRVVCVSNKTDNKSEKVCVSQFLLLTFWPERGDLLLFVKAMKEIGVCSGPTFERIC